MIDYKTRIFLLKISRKVLAGRLNLTYSALTARLNGFINWQSGEETLLNKILSDAEKVRESETEKSTPFFQR